MKSHWVIRDLTVADHPGVLAMNNAAAPNVNTLAPHEFDWLLQHAAYCRALEDAGGISGFVLCVPSGTEYWSLNYKWFTERYATFLYLDRVVVAERARGQGVGRALYEDMHAFGAEKWPRVALEVNLRPPNAASVAFHERLGYEAAGVREYDDGEKAVTLYVRELR